MAVKMEMEMPSSCAKCKFGRLEGRPDNPRWFCISEYKYYRIFPTKRPSWCPLKEIKECPTKEQIEEIKKEICARAGMPYSMLFGGKKKR